MQQVLLRDVIEVEALLFDLVDVTTALAWSTLRCIWLDVLRRRYSCGVLLKVWWDYVELCRIVSDVVCTGRFRGEEGGIRKFTVRRISAGVLIGMNDDLPIRNSVYRLFNVLCASHLVLDFNRETKRK